MDSKTRAQLRGLSNKVKATVIIGKDGVTENVLKQLQMELDAKELVKVSVLENDLDYKQILNTLAEKLNAEPICAIGKKLVLYRFSPKKKTGHILELK